MTNNNESNIINNITNENTNPTAPVPQPPPPTAPIDLDAIPNQIGHAILRASDGTMLRPPTGSLSERDVGIVYRMMLEIGTVLNINASNDASSNNGKDSREEEGLGRVTVGFRDVSYAIVLGGGDGCLYVVKKRSLP